MSPDWAAVAARALELHLGWADTFERGGLDPAALKSTGVALEPGERLAVLVPEAMLVDLEVAAVPKVTTVRARGALVATDRRVVVAGEGGTETVRWEDPAVGEVRTEVGGFGCLVVRPDASGLWGWVPPLLLEPDPPRSLALLGIAQWMRVTAAWYAHGGRLTEWRTLTARWLDPGRREA